MTTKRPSKFDANLIVIGAGSAGLISAYIAATVKAKVILIESDEMGGDCLNSGCIPSKALIAAANAAHITRDSQKYGVHCDSVRINFREVMAHVKTAISTIAPNDSMERYRKLGVQCIAGHARLTGPWTVSVNDQNLTARSIIIATGAGPAIPPLAGLDGINYLTSDTIWNLAELPKRLCILGGGPIGCELAQAFSRLGSEVHIVEMQERLMINEDPDVSDVIEHRFLNEGITLHLSSRAESVVNNRVTCSKNDGPFDVEFDQLLVATGRKPRTSGFGLEELGVCINPNQSLAVNGFLQTNFKHILACGDVAGPYQFTHAASHQAWHASVNALFGMFKKFKVNYTYLPWTTYTHPEVAHIGLNEIEATKKKIEYELTKFPLNDLDRAIAEQRTQGFIKILTRPGSDKIIGTTIVSPSAGEIIGLVTLAMKNKIGLNGLLSLIVPYPGWNETIKRSAGVWKQKHAPQWLMPWLKRFHSMMRN
jgi:pyruvate/2-oxoglutarate dehydrogenase complex dihydrolipoamide dehydrogenase (E3) component